MSDAELDKILATPLPQVPNTRLAERVTARVLEDQLNRRRRDVAISIAAGGIAVVLLPFTSVGAAISSSALSSAIAQPLGVTVASIILSFMAMRLVRIWGRLP